MDSFYVASPPTVVEIPNFIADVVFPVLPAFFEAVGLKSLVIRKMTFSPDHEEERQDPPRGEVTFEPGWGESVMITFTVRYRVGEEGTRGSLSKIERIEYRIGKRSFMFEYIEHRCHCRQCPGVKYPFLPDAETYGRAVIEEMSDEQRLVLIRRYVGKF